LMFQIYHSVERELNFYSILLIIICKPWTSTKNKGIFFEMKRKHVATIKAAVLMTSEGLSIIFFISSQSPTFSILNGWINILYFSRILI
jgi:hypothetical protein